MAMGSATSVSSTVATPASTDPVADLSNLLDAIDNAKSSKEKLVADHRAEVWKLVLAAAAEAAKTVDPANAVNKRKDLEDKEANYKEQLAALDSFIERFETQIKSYIQDYPQQAELALTTKLGQLEKARSEQETGKEALNEKIKKIRTWLDQVKSSSKSP